MPDLEIPFMSLFKDAVLYGRKTCTSRTRKYGEPGDVFTAFGAQFRIVRVERLPLKYVATIYHQEEGFCDASGFISAWRKLHQVRGYVPDQVVYVHFFIRIADQRDLFDAAVLC